MSEDNWYTSGFGGLQAEAERQATQYGPSKFFLKQGAKKTIMFVDDDPCTIHEHSPKINGSWGTSYTCIREAYPDDVACCELMGQDTRHFVGYFTIVDFDEWLDKKGVLHKNEIKLLPAKFTSLKLLKSKKEGKENRLAGRIYTVQRIAEKAPSIGDDFEYERDIKDPEGLFNAVTYKGKKLADLFKSESEEDIERLKKTFRTTLTDGKITQKLVPFSYGDILRPKKPKEIKDALRGVRIERGAGKGESGSSGGGATSGEDKVPF
jgi:hypothetical protein